MDSYYDWLYPGVLKDYEASQIILLSMIDSWNDLTTISKWEETKLQFLIKYRTLANKRFGKINVFILEPKSI